MQPRLPKPQPKRLSYPAGSQLQQSFGTFSFLCGSYSVPLSPHPCAWLPPAPRGRWSHAAGWPRAGAPWCEDRGATPAPSTQPLPAQRPRQHGRQKMSPWQPCGTLACFASFGQRGGIGNSSAVAQARPRQWLRGWHAFPGPMSPSRLAGRLVRSWEGRRVPGAGGPRSRDPGAVGVAGLPAGTASCRQGPEARFVHGCLRRLL